MQWGDDKLVKSVFRIRKVFYGSDPWICILTLWIRFLPVSQGMFKAIFKTPHYWYKFVIKANKYCWYWWVKGKTYMFVRLLIFWFIHNILKNKTDLDPRIPKVTDPRDPDLENGVT